MKKKIFIIGVVILVVLVLVGYNFIYKDHRNIKTETAEFVVTAEQLSQEFSQNETEATAKYADKTIVVTGKSTAYDEASGTVTIDEILSATLADKSVKIATQSPVKIKGRFVGYDDLLPELKMDQVTLIK